jgi:hypothetical protein
LAITASNFSHVRPPRHLTWLIEVIGVDHTLRLIEARGGSRMWVPKGIDNSSAKLRSDLEDEFGKPMVRALIRGFGGGPIKVPLAVPWRIQLYHAAGIPTDRIAISLVCSTVTVEKYIHLGRVGAERKTRLAKVTFSGRTSASASRP